MCQPYPVDFDGGYRDIFLEKPSIKASTTYSQYIYCGNWPTYLANLLKFFLKEFIIAKNQLKDEKSCLKQKNSTEWEKTGGMKRGAWPLFI